MCHTHHAHVHTQAGAHVLVHLTWPSSSEPRRSVITHVPLRRQPPARFHSALLVLTWPDMPVARGASRGSQGKPTTTVVAANWLCVGPWVTARSAMADTFFPLVSGKALPSPLLRPQTGTEPHMPGRVGLLMVGPAPLTLGREQRWLSTQDCPGEG